MLSQVTGYSFLELNSISYVYFMSALSVSWLVGILMAISVGLLNHKVLVLLFQEVPFCFPIMAIINLHPHKWCSEFLSLYPC